MREILFRGKDAIYREWIYGDLLTCASCTQIWQDSDFGKFPASVIPETVSQFTGLYDKNGVRIFENDIVRFTCTPNWLYQVICDKEFAMFGLKCVKSPSLYNKEACGTNFYDIDSRDVEVIGNRFDNPELLKGK